MRDYLAALKRRLAPADSPYLRALHDGSLTRDEFVATQVQFLFAVAFFSRPMAALAGRLPRPEMRLALLENVADEHGSGNLRFCHESTFLALLARLGVTPEQIERRALWPEVRAFNTVLVGACALDDTLTALAALGIVEDLFAGISASIGRGIVARGFLACDQVVHYATHEALDVDHAEGFYRELEGPYARHPRHAYQVQQGLELGGYAFLRLYEDLYRARGRQRDRDVGGPHSLADGWHLDVVR
ncbi:MAG TPA: iron-containing redox enzyme family protein [Polyangiaceae bacterium]|nr:iron-containing redox enzyme family protein [Polyangiaceae bacterium]